MKNRYKTFRNFLFLCILTVTLGLGYSVQAYAADYKDMIVVIDAGHGGNDYGAIDNGAREKDINLAVAKKLGELIRKKLKHTKVIFTRDDDTFVTLQGRADIANKAKADLFISIHANSVDAKNKNRRTVEGASVYTQGGHKDEANLAVAKRENSVIELENGYEQKYSGFDPNKVESYIIFEMAQKNTLNQSFRFAKDVQNNLVKIAGRNDRGVHQAGFWVLWATSMPSVLVELDFICNPESAAFMTSSHGTEKLAEGIFEAVRNFESSYLQKQRMMEDGDSKRKNSASHSSSSDWASGTRADATENLEFYDDPSGSSGLSADYSTNNTSQYYSSDDYQSSGPSYTGRAVETRSPDIEQKDLSHSALAATNNQRRARNSADGRRRRSADARMKSTSRNVSVNHIEVRDELADLPAYVDIPEESTSQSLLAAESSDSSAKSKGKSKKNKKDKKDKKEDKKKNAQKKGTDPKSFQTSGSKSSYKIASSDKKQDPKVIKGSREWVEEVNKIAAQSNKSGNNKNVDSKKNRDMAKARNSSTKDPVKSKSQKTSSDTHAGGRKSLKSKNN